MRLLALITICVLLNNLSRAQREADIWYFGIHCGLDFSSGVPQTLVNGQITSNSHGEGTICDSTSQLLFYNSSGKVFNAVHEIMENGQNFNQLGAGTQSNLILPWPKSDSLYFIFKIDSYNVPGGNSGISYNVVDMSMNNGLGAVTIKDIPLVYAWDANDLLTASCHDNKRDIWLITRKFREDKYAVFLITPDGINEIPDTYSASSRFEWEASEAYMKISYNKKYLFTCFNNGIIDDVEISRFNSETGEIDFLYNHIIYDYEDHPTSVEFSPDSKFAYIAYNGHPDSATIIRQYDMEYVEDPQLFKQSQIDIGGDIGRYLQLATDGRIYCLCETFNQGEPYIGVINKPWEEGVSCNYSDHAVNLSPGYTALSFPVVFMDYLYRFEFDGACSGEPFQFTSNFNPVPDSIYWTFDDPLSGSNHSNELNPVHVFSSGGIFEVEADVWYPSGRYEHTSRMVEVALTPEPNLGPDTAICRNSEILLDAECGPHSYLWSTNQFGSSQIIVSDTGWYWVKVTSDEGCVGYDSIYISYQNPAVIDSTNLLISPTTCGGETGSVTGLAIDAVPPFTYYWLDDVSDTIATTLDIFHLGVGNYTLQIIDGNGCMTESGPYKITDAGDVLIDIVLDEDEHCNQQNGSIIITATSGLGEKLFYSIDGGNNYESNHGVFTGLPAGTYLVRVQDSTLCTDVYDNNPVILNNTQHPEIISVQVTPETSGQNDGQIHITAQSPGDTIYYSLNPGGTTQINNGLFDGLTHGYYTCMVSDEYGCDTTFMVEVAEQITTILEAVAGEDNVCPGLVAYVPLVVSNFNDVKSFRATLLFNPDKLICQGYTNANSQLSDSLEVLLFPAEGKVELQWHDASVSLPSNSKLADLVFDATTTGGSLIEWDGSTGSNTFYNASGTQIPVEYHVGEVIIFREVNFTIGDRQVCEGKNIFITPSLLSSNGDVTYNWTLPDGSSSHYQTLTLNNVSEDQSGIYHLLVTDTAGCFHEQTAELIVFAAPQPEFYQQDTIFTEEPIEIDAGYGFLQYYWNTGDTSQIITAEDEGWYTALVQNMNLCFGSDSVFVTFKVIPEPVKIYLPNAFTPNNDGLNDTFLPVPQYNYIKNYHLSIYNRWGQMIFETSDVTIGWDGTHKGQLCPAGVYVYRIAFDDFGAQAFESKVKEGTVVLVR